MANHQFARVSFEVVAWWNENVHMHAGKALKLIWDSMEPKQIIKLHTF